MRCGSSPSWRRSRRSRSPWSPQAAKTLLHGTKASVSTSLHTLAQARASLSVYHRATTCGAVADPVERLLLDRDVLGNHIAQQLFNHHCALRDEHLHKSSTVSIRMKSCMHSAYTPQYRWALVASLVPLESAPAAAISPLYDQFCPCCAADLVLRLPFSKVRKKECVATFPLKYENKRTHSKVAVWCHFFIKAAPRI